MSVFSSLFNIQSLQSHGRRDSHDRKTRSKRYALIESLESRHLMATDVILEWNNVLLTANAADHSGTPEQGGPILTARAFAMVSVSMYDAYNSIERIGAPFLIRATVNRKSDSDAAVAQAAHDTLSSLYPSQLPRFDAALSETLARIPNGEAEDRGRALGAKVAAFVLLDRADDGIVDLMHFSSQYHPKGLPGFHDVDPLHPNQGFYAAGSSHLLPFAVEDIAEFQPRRLDDGTPAGRMEFMQSAEYKAAYDEVNSLGSDGVSAPTQRTLEQTQIGIYWAYDGRPGLGTPQRLYNQIVQTIAIQQNNSVAQNARLFAMINVAQADAGLAAWNCKYADDLWRPVLGVRGGDNDGNPLTIGDSDWLPLGAPASNPRPGDTNFTPPFPSYVSGHASFGASVFQALKRFYGRDDIKFTFVSDELNGITRDVNGTTRPVVSRTFNSFSQAEFENAQSRIYLGIHWAFDRDDGIKTGDKTANFVFDHTLQPKSSSNLALRHNTFDPMDVDDDGECTPLDVLVVVNMLNSQNSSSPDFVDVDGDNTVSPLDALIIINQLNAAKSTSSKTNRKGEGEQTDRQSITALPWFTTDRSSSLMPAGETVRYQAVEAKRQEATSECISSSVEHVAQAEQSSLPIEWSEVDEAATTVRSDYLSRDTYFTRLGEILRSR